MPTSDPARPLVSLDRAVCGDPAAALRREWLVTNGLGGYAAMSLAGTPTRSYHGYLVAALRPPVGRTVLVGGLEEVLAVGANEIALHALEVAPGRLDPEGFRHLEHFELDGTIPTWRFAIRGTVLEKRAWMARRANATYVSYRLVSAPDGARVRLAVTPLVTCRDHHAVRPGDRRSPRVAAAADGGDVRWPGVPTVLRLVGRGASFAPGGGWVRGLVHREETARGEPDRSDLARAGTFVVELAPGESWTLALAADDVPAELDGVRALAAERDRLAALLGRAGLDDADRRGDAAQGRAAARGTDADRAGGAEPRAAVHPATDLGPLVRQLVLAADQFLVERRIPGETTPGLSVIAGYPWFNDWGRDTMISLPGLCLATGRAGEAARILRSYAPWVRDGLVPNNFPDAEHTEPAYHAFDAALHYVRAVRTVVEATGDERLADDLLATLRQIVDRHLGGTRFGIGVDPADGLLRGGVPGVQLTWMDAKAGDWVVTPRIGKPVEIQALWVHALRTVAAFCRARGEGGRGRWWPKASSPGPDGADAAAGPSLRAAADRYDRAADQAVEAFRRRFFRPELGWCADVVDGPGGDDLSLRPNQLLAVALPEPLLAPDEARSVVDACRRSLLVPLGLRTLAPGDPAYHGAYGGDRLARDGAYHQGTAWSWLVGPYADALRRTGAGDAEVRALVAPFVEHLRDAGLGTVGEIFGGDPPHEPAGCFAQAWGVAEVLRIARTLAG